MLGRNLFNIDLFSTVNVVVATVLRRPLFGVKKSFLCSYKYIRLRGIYLFSLQLIISYNTLLVVFAVQLLIVHVYCKSHSLLHIIQ